MNRGQAGFEQNATLLFLKQGNGDLMVGSRSALAQRAIPRGALFPGI